jgi:N-acetylglucosamine-6-sulfatase
VRVRGNSRGSQSCPPPENAAGPHRGREDTRCAPGTPDRAHGQSWKRLAAGDASAWRHAWFYEYNYEKESPYTPNVRGVRTDEWKYMHSPHGDGGLDRHKAELYHLKDDPQELRNLIDDPAAQAKLKELQAELARLMAATGALPDRMPLDEGVKMELPEKSIR